MAYEEMKCRKCGKPIQYAEGAPWIRCVYCGAEYTVILNDNGLPPQ